MLMIVQSWCSKHRKNLEKQKVHDIEESPSKQWGSPREGVADLKTACILIYLEGRFIESLQ